MGSTDIFGDKIKVEPRDDTAFQLPFLVFRRPVTYFRICCLCLQQTVKVENASVFDQLHRLVQYSFIWSPGLTTEILMNFRHCSDIRVSTGSFLSFPLQFHNCYEYYFENYYRSSLFELRTVLRCSYVEKKNHEKLLFPQPCPLGCSKVFVV